MRLERKLIKLMLISYSTRQTLRSDDVDDLPQTGSTDLSVCTYMHTSTDMAYAVRSMHT